MSASFGINTSQTWLPPRRFRWRSWNANGRRSIAKSVMRFTRKRLKKRGWMKSDSKERLHSCMVTWLHSYIVASLHGRRAWRGQGRVIGAIYSLMWLAVAGVRAAADTSVIRDVEWQPLSAQIQRVTEAM